MAKIFGSNSVEESQKILAERFAKKKAAENARIKANALLRGTKTDIQPRKKVKKDKSRGTIAKREAAPKIKIDPNVKPIGAPVAPFAQVLEGIRGAFNRAKTFRVRDLAEGNERGAGGTKFKFRDLPKIVKEQQQAKSREAAKDQGNKIIDPETVKERVIKQRKLPGQITRAPLPTAISRRKAAKARKVNLGGSRSDRSREGRERPVRVRK